MIKKVLCVDDDSISLTISQLLLKRTGFAGDVATAIDGSDALEYFGNLFSKDPDPIENAPQLILLDINMPVMNGWEFLEEYKQFQGKLPKPIAIYMVSSSVNSSDMQKSRSYNAVSDYLVKPVSRSKYQELMESL